MFHTLADKRNAIWAKPCQNPAVTSMLRTCFFAASATAVGNREEARCVSLCPDREDKHEIPMPMLALVGAALHSSLFEWRTGAEVRFISDLLRRVRTG
ncbi:hypothetical protein LXA43DRAFT_1014182 [Ganoderma leucocontextum]|nr:hypothetical protein LXA43DRAFT_1014182 [Ganoderma leucocontextum]